MIVYLCSRYGRRQELLKHANELQSLGHRISSLWVYQNNEELDKVVINDRDTSIAHALKDISSIISSDVLIFFSEPHDTQAKGASRGGRHVEFGYALAISQLLQHHELRIIVIGECENIFHHLPEVEQYDTWQDMLIQTFPEFNH